MLKAFKSSSTSTHKPKPKPGNPSAPIGGNINTPTGGSNRKNSCSSMSGRPSISVNTSLSRNKSVHSNKSVSSSKSNASMNSTKSYNSMSSNGSSSITTMNSNSGGSSGSSSSGGFFSSAKHHASTANGIDNNIKNSTKTYLSPIDNSPLVPNYNHYKFLIVDDNLINLKILYKILSKIFPNSLIIKLTNSSTIMKLMDKEKFDLVFLDIEMPPINGIDISKKIRMNKKFNNIGLIAVTTKSNEKDITLYKKIGIDFTFKKPMNYNLNLILNNIEIILNYRKHK